MTPQRFFMKCYVQIFGLLSLYLYTLGHICDELSFGTSNLTWDQASSPPVIDSQEDQECLNKFLNDSMRTGPFWLGIQQVSPQNWAWVDLSDTSSTNEELFLRYQGCYLEFFSDRDLPHSGNLDSDQVNIDNCTTACGKQGFLYAGLHNGDKCYCGNTFGKYGTATNCPNLACSGDPSQKCGSSGKNAIYRVDGTWGNWADSQPNNFEGNQYCVAITKSGSSLVIQDEDCGEVKYQYVCEKTVTSTSCDPPKGFTTLGLRNSMCYYLSTENLEWYLAQQSCRDFGGQLLTIKTAEVYESIQDLTPQLPDEKLWVGCQRNRWQDINGNPVTFTQFAAGQQPKSSTQNHCVAVVRVGESYVWESLSKDSDGIEEVIVKTLTTTAEPPTTTAEMTETISTAATTQMTDTMSSTTHDITNVPIDSTSVLTSTTQEVSSSTVQMSTSTSEETPGDTAPEVTTVNPDSQTTETDQADPNNQDQVPDTAASTTDGLSTVMIVIIVVICVLVVAILIVIFVIWYSKNRSPEKIRPTLDLRGQASKPNGGTLFTIEGSDNKSFTSWSMYGNGSTNMTDKSCQSNTPRSNLSSKSSLGLHRNYSPRRSNRVGIREPAEG